MSGTGVKMITHLMLNSITQLGQQKLQFLPPVILVVMMVTMSKGSCSHDRDNCNDNRKEGTTKPTNFGVGQIHFSPRSRILGTKISPAPDDFHSRCTICASFNLGQTDDSHYDEEL